LKKIQLHAKWHLCQNCFDGDFVEHPEKKNHIGQKQEKGPTSYHSYITVEVSGNLCVQTTHARADSSMEKTTFLEYIIG
jgi:hypothetical protein